MPAQIPIGARVQLADTLSSGEPGLVQERLGFNYHVWWPDTGVHQWLDQEDLQIVLSHSEPGRAQFQPRGRPRELRESDFLDDVRPGPDFDDMT